MAKGLKHLKSLRVETVEVSDGDTFTVRGLDLVDIIKLAEAHADQLSGLFDQIANGGLQSAMADMPTVAATFFKVAPMATVEVIALAANEEDIDLVRLLPLVVQIDALEKIGRLTFASNSPKKVLETITRVMASATEAMRLPA